MASWQATPMEENFKPVSSVVSHQSFLVSSFLWAPPTGWVSFKNQATARAEGQARASRARTGGSGGGSSSKPSVGDFNFSKFLTQDPQTPLELICVEA